jgi:hypothetical protein
MPRRKPKYDKETQEKLKNSLESLLSDEGLDIPQITDEDLPKIRTTESLDTTSIKIEAETDAKIMLESVVDFYLTNELINKKEYVSYKQKIDSMNLSSMMFQLRAAQHMVVKVIEEIDLGAVNPRMIEIFCQLQTQLAQIPKNYTEYLSKMEDSYKRMQVDSDSKSERGDVIKTQDGDIKVPEGVSDGASEGVRTRGTRSLMENLQTIFGENKVIEGQLEIVDESIDPRVKAQHTSRSEGEEEGQDIDDEYFS